MATTTRMAMPASRLGATRRPVRVPEVLLVLLGLMLFLRGVVWS
jgi:hypothetical protein